MMPSSLLSIAWETFSVCVPEEEELRFSSDLQVSLTVLVAGTNMASIPRCFPAR